MNSADEVPVPVDAEKHDGDGIVDHHDRNCHVEGHGKEQNDAGQREQQAIDGLVALQVVQSKQQDCDGRDKHQIVVRLGIPKGGHSQGEQQVSYDQVEELADDDFDELDERSNGDQNVGGLDDDGHNGDDIDEAILVVDDDGDGDSVVVDNDVEECDEDDRASSQDSAKVQSLRHHEEENTTTESLIPSVHTVETIAKGGAQALYTTKLNNQKAARPKQPKWSPAYYAVPIEVLKSDVGPYIISAATNTQMKFRCGMQGCPHQLRANKNTRTGLYTVFKTKKGHNHRDSGSNLQRYENEPLEDSDDECVLDDKVSEEVVFVQSRPRGATAQSLEEESDAEAQPLKRKRGRPPKIRTGEESKTVPASRVSAAKPQSKAAPSEAIIIDDDSDRGPRPVKSSAMGAAAGANNQSSYESFSYLDWEVFRDYATQEDLDTCLQSYKLSSKDQGNAFVRYYVCTKHKDCSSLIRARQLRGHLYLIEQSGPHSATKEQEVLKYFGEADSDGTANLGFSMGAGQEDAQEEEGFDEVEEKPVDDPPFEFDFSPQSASQGEADDEVMEEEAQPDAAESVAPMPTMYVFDDDTTEIIPDDCTIVDNFPAMVKVGEVTNELGFAMPPPVGLPLRKAESSTSAVKPTSIVAKGKRPLASSAGPAKKPKKQGRPKAVSDETPMVAQKLPTRDAVELSTLPPPPRVGESRAAVSFEDQLVREIPQARPSGIRAAQGAEVAHSQLGVQRSGNQEADVIGSVLVLEHPADPLAPLSPFMEFDNFEFDGYSMAQEHQLVPAASENVPAQQRPPFIEPVSQLLDGQPHRQLGQGPPQLAHQQQLPPYSIQMQQVLPPGSSPPQPHPHQQQAQYHSQHQNANQLQYDLHHAQHQPNVLPHSPQFVNQLQNSASPSAVPGSAPYGGPQYGSPANVAYPGVDASGYPVDPVGFYYNPQYLMQMQMAQMAQQANAMRFYSPLQGYGGVAFHQNPAFLPPMGSGFNPAGSPFQMFGSPQAPVAALSGAGYNNGAPAAQYGSPPIQHGQQLVHAANPVQMADPQFAQAQLYGGQGYPAGQVYGFQGAPGQVQMQGYQIAQPPMQGGQGYPGQLYGLQGVPGQQMQMGPGAQPQINGGQGAPAAGGMMTPPGGPRYN